MADAQESPGPNDWFASTHWSLILLAGQGSSPASQAALEQLCRGYWPPLFGYARRLGHPEADAKDLTQAFFEQFLQKGYIRAADPQRGRFRGFLRTCFRHFIEAEWTRARAQKRGGQAMFISWDEIQGMESLDSNALGSETPDRIYDRLWAVRLFSRAMDRLRLEFVQSCRGNHFEVLRPFLESSGDQAAHAEAARQLQSNVNAVVVAIHRLRQRLRQLVREEVAHTVSRPEDLEDELRYLRELLGA